MINLLLKSENPIKFRICTTDNTQHYIDIDPYWSYYLVIEYAVKIKFMWFSWTAWKLLDEFLYYGTELSTEVKTFDTYREVDDFIVGLEITDRHRTYIRYSDNYIG